MTGAGSLEPLPASSLTEVVGTITPFQMPLFICLNTFRSQLPRCQRGEPGNGGIGQAYPGSGDPIHPESEKTLARGEGTRQFCPFAPAHAHHHLDPDAGPFFFAALVLAHRIGGDRWPICPARAIRNFDAVLDLPLRVGANAQGCINADRRLAAQQGKQHAASFRLGGRRETRLVATKVPMRFVPENRRHTAWPDDSTHNHPVLFSFGTLGWRRAGLCTVLPERSEIGRMGWPLESGWVSRQEFGPHRVQKNWEFPKNVHPPN